MHATLLSELYETTAEVAHFNVNEKLMTRTAPMSRSRPKTTLQNPILDQPVKRMKIPEKASIIPRKPLMTYREL
jgi:hypothetical protein